MNRPRPVKRAFVLCATALGLLSACAATTMGEPRLQVLGENSYMVTLTAAETPDGKKLARREAMRVAEAHCVERGQHARPTHLASGVSDFMFGGEVELNFRCQEEEFRGP